MNQETLRPNTRAIFLNKLKTFFSKPYNVILLLLGIVLSVTTIAPIVAIVQDTFQIHPGTIDAHLAQKASGWTIVNYTALGRQMEAVSQDRLGAALQGININRVIISSIAL